MNRRLLRAVVLLLALGGVAFLFRDGALNWLGSMLVEDQGPAKADAALVLAGDYNGDRILRAASLAKQGYVPLVLVSGPRLLYDRHESEFAIAYAVSKGCRQEWFVPLENHALSTEDEARELLPVIGSRGIRSFLLITSNYHTARAARVFRRVARDLKLDNISMRVVASSDRNFEQAAWWQTREGRKTVFFEWSKTVAYAFGM